MKSKTLCKGRSRPNAGLVLTACCGPLPMKAPASWTCNPMPAARMAEACAGKPRHQAAEGVTGRTDRAWSMDLPASHRTDAARPLDPRRHHQDDTAPCREERWNQTSRISPCIAAHPLSHPWPLRRTRTYELEGTAYAVIEGIDGRTHHLRFDDLEAALDAIVETRAYEDPRRRKRLSLAVRSDFTVEQQVTARGSTWLERRLLDADAAASASGFGAEVTTAMEKRLEFLEAEGLARKRTQGIVFARDLLATLRKSELDYAIARIAQETGLAHQPVAQGDYVAGTYRDRIALAPGASP